MKILFIIAALSPALAIAQLSDADLKKQTRTMENKFKLTPFIEQIEQGSVDSNQLAAIHAMLKHTAEVRIHQQNGASGNKVFVHQDGHKEAVYDKDGNLVKDGVNDGSYNYYHPSEEPLRHFAFDISPWILWGQSRTDPTTVKGRIYAYMGDLEGGIGRALAAREKSTNEIEWKRDGQLQTLALFLRAIQEGNAEGLFAWFESGQNPTDKKLVGLLTRLNRGLEAIYTPPK